MISRIVVVVLLMQYQVYGLRPLARVVIATSVNARTPNTEWLETALNSVVGFGVPIVIAADALPKTAEVAALGWQDGDKWRAIWKAKHRLYDEYLRQVAQIIAPRYGATLQVAPCFGHLSGSVRRGLAGLADEEWALVSQHDLALRAPDLLPLASIGQTLMDTNHPTQYILLSRDDTDSPRSRSWFQQLPREASTALRTADGFHTLLDLNGGFSDQSHFTSVGWYRSHVLDKCHHTCMEHQVHNQLAAQSTALFPGRTLIDLDHGAMIRTTSIPFHIPFWQTSNFEIVSNSRALPIHQNANASIGTSTFTSPSSVPTDWSVIHYTPQGLVCGAVNHVDDDASKPASLFASAKTATTNTTFAACNNGTSML